MTDFSKEAYANKSLITNYLKEKDNESKLIEDTELDLTFDGVSKGDYNTFHSRQIFYMSRVHLGHIECAVSLT